MISESINKTDRFMLFLWFYYTPEKKGRLLTPVVSFNTLKTDDVRLLLELPFISDTPSVYFVVVGPQSYL